MDKEILYVIGVLLYPIAFLILGKLIYSILTFFLSRATTESGRYFIIALFLAFIVWLMKHASWEN